MSNEKGFRGEFGRILLGWNREKNRRKMPWKGEKDPYRVWLSEIILQQTRVEQGLNYYNSFIEVFPDVHALANAEEQKVFKLWEGLGYYTRCKNLLATARFVSRELGGRFPRSFDEIKKLKGIGPYTASAIASFAYNQPHAVLDGNVFRVFARIFGISTPIDTTKGKKEFAALAEELLDREEPASYNQAIMDFGATICKPIPACGECVFRKHCHAYTHQQIAVLPVKDKKGSIRKRWFHYLVLEYGGNIAIRQRLGKDIWNQLYEYPMLEATCELQEEELVHQARKNGIIEKGKYEISGISTLYRQQLSHQVIHGKFICININSRPVNQEGWTWISPSQLPDYPLPRIINSYLEKSAETSLE